MEIKTKIFAGLLTDACYYASTIVAGFTRVFLALPRIRLSGGFEGWQYR